MHRNHYKLFLIELNDISLGRKQEEKWGHGEKKNGEKKKGSKAETAGFQFKHCDAMKDQKNKI